MTDETDRILKPECRCVGILSCGALAVPDNSEKEEWEMTETRLLLLDDEQAFVTVTEKRLAKRNMKITVAYTGEEGLKKLDDIPEIDVVLLDVKMPGMDGTATLKE
jgi:response regulator RpfG family c-di-GMP phosphodiesterase